MSPKKDSGFFVNFKDKKQENPQRIYFAKLNVLKKPNGCSINYIHEVKQVIMAGRCNCGKIHPVFDYNVDWCSDINLFKKIFSMKIDVLIDPVALSKIKWPLRMGEQEHSHVPTSGNILNVFVPKVGLKVKLSDALPFSQIFNFKMSGTYGLVVAEPILSKRFSRVNSLHGLDHLDFLNISDHGVRVPRLDLFKDKPSNFSATLLNSFIEENEGIVLFS